MLSENLCKIFAVIVQTSEGNRIYSKYYNRIFAEKYQKFQNKSFATQDCQQIFEKQISEKAKKLINSQNLKSADTEIFTHSNFNLVFKKCTDITIFVVGDFEENELMLSSVLDNIYESLNHFTKNQINKNSILDNFEQLILIIDEIIDQGMIVNLDYNNIVTRCQMLESVPIQEEIKQTSSSSYFSSVFASAKNQFSKTLNIS